MATQDQINDLTALYAGYFDRAPDPAGLEFWIAQIDNGRAFNTIAADFAGSPEAVALYPYLSTPGVSSPAAFFTQIYANLFNRLPDAAGLAFWTGVLASGSVSVADMIEAVINGAVDDAVAGTFDKTTLDNKIEVGLYFATEAGNTPGFVYDADAAAAAVEVLDGVTNNPATVAEGKAETDAFLLPTGEIFTLTQVADIGPAFVGTSADDVYNAPAEQTSFLPIQTLTDGDILDGGEGRDTLNAGIVNQFTVPAGLKSIEVLNLSAPQALFGSPNFTPTLDVIHADSLDTLGVRGFPNGLTINNLSTALDDINLQDILSTPQTVITVNSIGTALDGADDSINLNVQNVTQGAAAPALVVLNTSSVAADAGIETINISSTGPVPNIFDVSNLGTATAATTTVNILGSANLVVNDAGGIRSWDAGTLELIDATGFTGNLNTGVTGTGDIEFLGGDGVSDVAFGRNVNATATGGASNDLFSFQAYGNPNGLSSFDGDDSVDGGGGTNNVLEIQAESGELLGGDGSGITNIQTVRHITDNPINGNDDDLNGDLTVNMAIAGSATTLELFGDYDGYNVTVNALTNADRVVYNSDKSMGNPNYIENLTLNHEFKNGILESLTLDIQGGSDIRGDLIIPFSPSNPLNSVEALLLNVGEGDTRIDGADQINADIQITGEGNLALGSNFNGVFQNGDYDFENGVIDASAFTGNLTIRLGSENQNIISGSGDDLIVLTTDSGWLGNGFNQDDQVDLSAGGSDIVRFLDKTTDERGALDQSDYHHVDGFDVTNDIIQLDSGNMGLVNTFNSGVGTGAVYANILNVVAGAAADGTTDGYEFIKFTSAINATGDSAQSAFAEAIGNGSIQVAFGTDDVLASMYDDALQQMVLFTVDADSTWFGSYITQTDDVDVIGTIGMSYADYLAFDTSNLAFV